MRCLLLVAPTTSERLTGIEEIYYEICLQCGTASHLGKKLLLPRLLYGMLYELNMQDIQRSDG